jgi:hypothetical protein
VLGNGLVSSEARFGIDSASLFNPRFLKARVQAYAPVMAELTERISG